MALMLKRTSPSASLTPTGEEVAPLVDQLEQEKVKEMLSSRRHPLPVSLEFGGRRPSEGFDDDLITLAEGSDLEYQLNLPKGGYDLRKTNINTQSPLLHTHSF